MQKQLRRKMRHGENDLQIEKKKKVNKDGKE
jgi:hypothetical protein